ncbi:S8 family serine peptidase [Clostridium sp. UBA7791]|uniref:S8 family serine peptidase n=1 Tax=Clostridium sp. UBA7791 TaxID=1946379 RepID=UPI003217D424
MKSDRLRRIMAGIFTIIVMTTSVFTTNGFVAYADNNELHIDVSRAHSITRGEKTILSAITDSQSSSEFDPLYKSDDEVTIIVELEDKPLIEYYSAEKTSDNVSSFITSAKSQGINNKLLKEQEVVTKRILKEVPIVVEQEYTVVMNGFSLTAKYGDLDTIKAVKGVKNAFVSTIHYLPEPEVGHEPTMKNSSEIISSNEANKAGYTGKNMVVAVLDTGLDVNHEAFKNSPEDIKYTETEITDLMNSKYTNAKGKIYKNEKIPFAYDYADKDNDVKDLQSHGTHVAGTVGANGENLTGVAPDAQLMIMKVFSDKSSGARDSDILAALNDAVALGADAINMSLGSGAGFTAEAEEVINKTYDRVAEAGINLMCAAGNDYSSSYNSNLGIDLPLVSNPDNSMVGSPSTYNAATSVASINNSKIIGAYILADETKIRYTDANEGTSKEFNSLEGESVEYVVIQGIGTVDDFKNIDVKGKIVLVKRGTITFTEKETNAVTAGASGIIVYDNAPGNLLNMKTDGKIPAIFISKEHGEILVNKSEKNISISKSYKEAFDSTSKGQMSDFSSWGVSPDLKLKPEITAPGGDIYSTLPGGVYGSMSGTSMATPHMAGASSLVRQYINEKFPSLTMKEKELLATQLLMSTAIPATDPDGVAYSPRKQGSGVANIYSAVKTSAYLIGSDGKPKAELGDSTSGEYSFKFSVKNTSDLPVKYTVDTTVLTEKILATDEGKFFAQASEELDASKVSATLEGIEGNIITVDGGKTESISISLKLTDSAKKDLKVCNNGTFIDGFVTLISENTDKINLNFPFVGFYGDWQAIPIFDNDLYDDETAAMYETTLGYFNRTTWKGSYLGVNLFNGKDKPVIADENKIAIGPNINGSYSVNAVVGLLRNAEEVSYTVTDSKGNEVYKNKAGKETKSFYDGNSGSITYAVDGAGWDSMNSKGNNPLEDGVYTYKISGIPIGGDEKDSQEIKFPVTIDTQEPELINTKIQTIDGVKYLTITLKDNHYLQGMQLVDEKGDPLTEIIVLDKDKTGSEYDQIFKIGDLNMESVKVVAVDYAMNFLETDSIALSEGDIAPESVTLKDRNLELAEGSEFQMSAKVNPYNSKDKTLTWSSSNEDVATISETGYVKALTKGETTITVSTVNGKTDSTTLKVVDKDELTTELKAPYIIYNDGNYKLPVDLLDKTVVIKDTAKSVSIVGNNTNTNMNPYSGVDISCEGNVDLVINNFNTKVTSFFKNAIEFKGAKNTLTLKGDNTLTSVSEYSDRAIISAAYGTELEILGKGTLNVIASKNNYGACIGGGSSEKIMDSGTINISDGVINATTYGAGAAIGGGYGGIATNINISGGKVTAIADVKSYNGSATIGSGSGAENIDKLPGTIKVTGGEIKAINCSNGATIGDCSMGKTDYNILVSGGSLSAESNSKSTLTAGAAIGSGVSAKGKISINISGGIVNATTTSRGAAIGGGSKSEAGTINIEGGTITATSSSYGAAIGSGYSGKKQDITILKGTIKATATDKGQAIGRGEGGEECTLKGINDLTPYIATISAPNVTNVKVDGVDWNITKGHEEDENIYLYLVDKTEPYKVEVLADGVNKMFLVTVKDGKTSVEEIDITPPKTPTIVEENGLVTLTAADEDTTKMEYSLDNKTWTVYTEPVKVDEKATIYVRAIDKAGNISEVAQYTVPDRTAPGVPKIKEEKGLVTLTPADEDTKVIQYSLDGKEWEEYSEPVQVPEKSTIYVRAIDEAGNISGVITYTIPDITAPKAPVITDKDGLVTLTAVDEDTVKMEYSLDNKNWDTYTEPVALKEQETIYVRAVDESGNISAIVSYISPDVTAPKSPIITEKSGVVTIKAADKDTAKMEYSLDNKNWTIYTEPVKVDEKVTIYVRAVDGYGNISELAQYTVPDRTAPKSPVITEKDGLVTLTAADKDTAKMEYSLDNKTWTIYKEPVKVDVKATIYARAIDEVGNISEIVKYKMTEKPEKPENPGNPEKPENPEKPSNPSTGKPSNPGTPSKPTGKIPQTGGMIGSGVMALGGIITVAIGSLVLKRKK